MARPGIPTAQDLRSARLSHRFGDVFNPPGLTNFRGAVQATIDPCGIRSIGFPPLAMGEVGAFGQGFETITGALFVDGAYAVASGEVTDFVWQPDRIERRQVRPGLTIETTLMTPEGEDGAIEELVVTNTGTQRRRVDIDLGLLGNVTRCASAWTWAQAPAEFDNGVTIDRRRGQVVFRSSQTAAVSVQGAYPRPDRIDNGRLGYTIELEPGDSWRAGFGVLLGTEVSPASRRLSELLRDLAGQQRRITALWDAELAAAFTPGNDRFGGNLPVLEDAPEDLSRIYWTALATLLFHKRSTPEGTVYVTLGPRYWQTTTFLWDISLCAPLLAQLDPASLRRQMERWMATDIHQHFGTDLLTGEGVGPWYSVNDYAMCRMAREYLVWTGDWGWLDREVAGRTVGEALVSYATAWRSLRGRGRALADYGGVANLLEAVGSYRHEVAGMNAANVYCQRFAADLMELSGHRREAGVLRRQAAALVRHIQDLYVSGAGYWRARWADGSLRDIRHCYDFATVMTTIGSDLSPSQRGEMVDFFVRELQTPTWMRALSARDRDVTFSVRPDHQWTGAYAAWPTICLNALFAAGRADLARRWMTGLAETLRQGPVAQAYFAEDVIAPEPGAGARKAPSEAPWINDWSCVAGFSLMEPIICGLFGVHADLAGHIEAVPVLHEGRARLRGLRHRDTLYDVDAGGLTTAQVTPRGASLLS